MGIPSPSGHGYNALETICQVKKYQKYNEESCMSNTPSKTMIEAKGLSKYYGPFVAIQDVSFSIKKGQICAFLGPNGAGKSTTMKILSGFLAASEGTATIAGYDVREDRMEVAKRLGYLPENGPLYPEMTPLELLQFFSEARCIGTTSSARKRIDEVIHQTSLETVIEKPISKLSRGYRQRVGLAQALLHDPEVIIMDEPTSGLDPNQIREFRANIKKLGKTKTILLSTHILQEVEAIADCVVFIHNGKLVFTGSPSDLKKQGSLEDQFYKLTNYGKAETDTEGVVA